MTDHDYDDAPVKVTLDGPTHVRGRSVVSITTEVFTLQPGVPQRILGENGNRCRAFIGQESNKANPAFIGTKEVTAGGAGYPLPWNQNTPGMELRTSSAVWAVIPTGGVATQVFVLAEHYDGT